MENKKDEFEKGLEKGVELGEMNERIKVTRKMLKKGYDINEIVDITDLEKKIILDIKKDLSSLMSNISD